MARRAAMHNFLLMALYFSLNHGAVVAVLNISVLLLGRNGARAPPRPATAAPRGLACHLPHARAAPHLRRATLMPIPAVFSLRLLSRLSPRTTEAAPELRPSKHQHPMTRL